MTVARCLACVLVWLAVMVVQARPAGAQAGATETELSGAQRAEYDELTKKGIREYELGHWAEAKAYFARAHRLFPNARTLRALGLIAYETRSYVEALDLFEEALTSQRKPLTDALRKEVSGLAGDAQTFVARITCLLEPATASVSIDGVPITLREGHVLLVDPGEYRLRVEAPGYVSEVRPLRASAGETSELKLSLPQVGAEAVASEAALPAQAPSAAEAAGFWNTQRVVAAGLAGGAVVALGIGVTSGLLALSAKSDSKNNCEGDLCNAEGSEQRDKALARADVASVAFIAGGALLAASAITFFLAPDPERASNETALRVVPGPGLAGIAVAGRL